MIFWFIHILLLGLFSYMAFRQLKSPFKPIIFWSALGFKLAAGIVLGLIFHYYYGTGDSLTFYDKAREMANLDISEHWHALIADSSYATNNHPRDLYFIKLLSVVVRMTGGSYWICSLYLSFFSFISSWYFVISFTKVYPAFSSVSIISFLFIPTIVFWSSGFLKDTLSSTSLILAVAILLKGISLRKISLLELVISVFSLFILFQIKHYLFITFILFGALFVSFHLVVMSTKKRKWIIALGILIITLFSTQYIHPYFKFDRIPQTVFEINKTIAENSSATNQNLVHIEEPTWSTILTEAPNAILTGLFRPNIFDATIAFGWFHRIENLVLLILSIFSILIWLKEKSAVDYMLLVPAVFSICMLATMLALSTPNFGSLVRYRNAFMPFLFLIVAILPYQYISSKSSE